MSLCILSSANAQQISSQYRPLSGPNVCGPKFYSYCCPGWTRHERFNTCTVPICNRNCQGGYCIRPNSCYCSGGTISVGGCDNNGQAQGVGGYGGYGGPQLQPGRSPCNIQCLNGGTCLGSTCSCRQGFSGNNCNQVVCTPPCQNGGRCIGGNRCSCPYGFVGQACETDYRTGPCFTVYEQDQCEGMIPGLLCTKAMCCATIGHGWGSPCESCDTFNNPCERGYFVDARTLQCRDADECVQVPGLCQGGECVNTIGSYTCTCPSGFRLNTLTQRCQDINECLENVALCENGRCINREGGFRCDCGSGYHFDSTTSTCISDGTVPPIVCPLGYELNRERTRCIRNIDVPEGGCPPGFELDFTSDGYRFCVPSVDSPCPDGYELSSDGQSCVPPIFASCEAGYVLDESDNCVRLLEGTCPPGYMLQSDGVTCISVRDIVCPSGWRLSRNGRMCIMQTTGDCDAGMALNEFGQCVDIPHGSCPEGYTLMSDGITCIDPTTGLRFCPARYELGRDRATCVPKGFGKCPAGHYPTESGNCIPIVVGFCPDGFELQPDGRTCVGNGGIVFCPRDYVLSQDGTACEEVTGGSVLVETETGFCYMRYRANRNTCTRPLAEKLTFYDCCCAERMQAWGTTEDSCDPCPTEGLYDGICGGVQPTRPPLPISICTMNPGICPNGRCIPDSNGRGFQCICNDGYERVGMQSCADVDECQDPEICSNGMCRNTQGSFTCTCRRGYQLSPDRRDCVDTDECEEDEETCMHGLCMNTDGSYMCDCFEGYKLSLDERYCYDIDECQTVRMCQNGRCANTEGSYECSCNEGYELTEDNLCEDKNECLDLACGPGTCENLIGSYRCICPAGFVESDGTCVEKARAFCYINSREGRCTTQSSTPVTISQCCCSAVAVEKSVSWGPGCDPCPPQGTSMFERLCSRGPGRDSFGLNINECLIFSTLCENGMCEDLVGNYRCSCNSGFRLGDGGKTCEDDNECAINRLLCLGGNCRNTPGSYVCECPDGYNFDTASSSCRDVDECLESPCVGGRCINTQGGFRCECVMPGMTLDDSLTICVDNRIGVCWTAIRGGRCEANIMGVMRRDECCATFGRAWGSPCEPCPSSSPCPPGYIPRVDGCEDIDECDINPMLCTNGRCINTDGSYQCICNNGLTLDTSGTMCVDVQSYKCYLDYAEEQCFEPIAGIYRKSVCCCSVGRAYGHGTGCNPCPEFETPEWDELCPRGEGFADNRETTELMDGSVVVEDINECVTFEDACANGACINHVGYFECECDMGYALEYDYSCVDINECSILTGVCGNGTCENRPGTFFCNCFEGFASFSVMMPTCEDINECETMPNVCRGGYCQNTYGSFKCICPSGQELTSDGMACRDIDECSSNLGVCSNGECNNLLGTYRCMCDEGFRPTASFLACEDMNECDMHKGGCDQVCVNTIGSFHCECEEGYSMMGDGTTCRDKDECAENPAICGGGECTNVIGAYRCTCDEGYIPSADFKMCLDINECIQNQNICNFGACENILGGYICSCDFGFSEKDGEQGCTDDDECAMGIHNCAINTVCKNTPGSFLCECAPGFIPDGDSCIDVDECESLTDDCNVNAQCVNTDGSFQCQCLSGFTGDGRDCQDFDECMHNQNLCQNGQCLNSAGNYHCECDVGFISNEDRDRCDDIDECSQFDNICIFGECMNFPGGFRCLCDDGYELDDQGANCTDVDECENSDVYCRNGNCTNEMGTYTCECPDDYTLSAGGTRCYDLRRGKCYAKVMDSDRGDSAAMCVGILSLDISRFQCCCTAGQGWGEPCMPCPEKNTTEYFQLCPDGAKMVPDGPGDIGDPNGGGPGPGGGPDSGNGGPDGRGPDGGGPDGGGPGPSPDGDQNECQLFPYLCEGGRCINTIGSYKCICPAGYRIDQENLGCEDIDECALSEYICGVGSCINQIGNFTCQCPTGFMYMDSVFGRNCMDIRKMMCYMAINQTNGEAECQSPLQALVTRKQCCCSRIEGAAWGDPCSPCPTPETEEYYTICSRFRGKILDEYGRPVDINECEIEGICRNGVCINENGGFHCECSLGYVYNENTIACEDVDECASGLDHCMGRAICVNVPGSHYCNCPAGFKPTKSGIACTDYNECIEEIDICGNGQCSNKIGGYDCACHRGYERSQDGSTCVDVNECDFPQDICGNGTCINTDGSHECDCYNGFERSENGDCQDVDECNTLMGRCPNGECVNTLGSFHCDCMAGYSPLGVNMACVDTDECLHIPGICENGYCQNYIGGFRCVCNDGYESTSIAGDFGEFCLNVNECAGISDICLNGDCVDLEGSFRCNCPPGFVLTNDGLICVDMRRAPCYEIFTGTQCIGSMSNNITMQTCCCSSGAGWGFPCELCPEEGTPAFDVMCPHGRGYAPSESPDTYSDIDECKMFPSECIDGDCINTDGSFRCECGPGRQLDSTGKVCEDIDECSSVPNICGRNSTCINTLGSFQCFCGEGFQTGRGGRCEDINECRRGRNLCAFRCQNLPGSYRCTCPRGFAVTEDGRLCRDFDECESGENNCRYGCRNLIGKFMCVCHDGYQAVGGNGNICRDIDECATRHGLCENGFCMNTPGSYQCICNAGFTATADLSECVDQRRGTCYGVLYQGLCQDPPERVPSITMSQCCCNGRGKAWGDDCEACPAFGTSEYLEMCADTTPPTIDICVSVVGLCENGLCLSGNGGFICQCNPGFLISRDGTRCEDKDECESNMCSHECRNTPGSFKCLCPHGYVLSHDMVTCEDKDECREDASLCGPHGTCQNTPGGYRCECQRFFRPDESGTMCVDIDECTEQPHRCQYECQNTVGGFNCGCPEGYVQNYWGQCGDQNECANQGACGDALCYNTQGSYQCSCQNGFVLDQQSLTCNDIDECLGYGYGGYSPCQNGCQNTPGSFTCGCPPGYHSVVQGACFSTLNQDSEVPCYSCHQTRRRRDVSAMNEDSFPGTEANNTVVLIRIPLRKVTLHSKLMKLTTGFSKSIGLFTYHIIDDENNVFTIETRKEGKALLRFSRLVTKAAIFSVEVEGKIVETEEAMANEDKTIITEPISLFVEVEVYNTE